MAAAGFLSHYQNELPQNYCRILERNSVVTGSIREEESEKKETEERRGRKEV